MIRLKSTLLALSLLTASPVFAQTNITGDWDVTVTSPQGTNTTPVTFKQEGAKVSGIFKGPQGSHGCPTSWPRPSTADAFRLAAACLRCGRWPCSAGSA